MEKSKIKQPSVGEDLKILLEYFDLPTGSLPAVGRAGIKNKNIHDNTISSYFKSLNIIFI
jgi:hypothetical protein